MNSANPISIHNAVIQSIKPFVNLQNLHTCYSESFVFICHRLWGMSHGGGLMKPFKGGIIISRYLF